MSDLQKRLSTLSPEKLALILKKLKKNKQSRPAGKLRSTRDRVLSAPIVPIARDERIPLSFAQQRLWFLHQLEGPSATYNMPAAFRLTGELNLGAFSESLNQIVRRHETLRTSFPTVDNVAVQHIAPHHQISIPIVDLTKETEAEREAEVQRLVLEEQERPFDLANGPLWRVNLLRLGFNTHILLFTMHHIISDGWSIGVLLREFSLLYNASRTGQPSPLPDLAIQYADFAHWQREWLTGELLEKQQSYWKSQLAGAPALLALPTDRPRPPIQSFHGGHYTFSLSKALSSDLLALSAKFGTTLFMTLQAAFATLLYRYSGQEDILVGTPIANRNRAEIEPLIGFFVNTLVLRTDLSGHPTFGELLKQVRAVTLSAQEHQDLPFEHLVEQLQPQRTLSHSPLFQVMFVFENLPSSPLALEGLTLTPLEQENRTAKFDLTLSISEPLAPNSRGGLTGSWEYNRDLYDRESIQRMAGHFETLLRAIVANPFERIEHLSLLTKAQRHQMLVTWNQTQVDYPLDKCIHELFEAQVERTPEAVAVQYKDKNLSYQELNAKANKIAHDLIKRGVEPDVPKGHDMLVGLCVERSLEMMVGLLGILKAGGAYVPLDPTYPSERLTFMLQDAGVRLLLTTRKLVAKWPELVPPGKALSLLCLDESESIDAPEHNPVTSVQSDHLAYCIYTSGSTGKPKGTLIEHRGLTNYLYWCTQSYSVAEGSGAPVNSSIGFDATITSLFSPLLVGGKVLLLPESEEIEALSAALQNQNDFSLVKITPAHLEILRQLVKTARGTKAFIIGGEALFAKHLEFWRTRAKNVRLVNEYGPTETVVGCCVYEVPPEKLSNAIPIGRPIANTQLYILDKHLQPLPIGVPGELYIGGAGVARGYLNRPELTQQKFIPNPFGPKGHPGRLYKTGDLCRYLPDGNIEFLGRIDHQVKIRGFRIELGEIEAVLNEHPQVRQTVLLAREDKPGDKRLVAYIVGTKENPLDQNNWRQYLSGKLPNYMVPHTFVMLDALPLTPNGKVDRHALPAPDRSRSTLQKEYVAPRTPRESRLATLWSEILGVAQVGIYDNFFELGGHSLLATQVVSRMREAWQAEVPLRYLFEFPTIAQLNEQLDHVQKATNPIQPVSREGELPLSFAQQRLSFLHQLEGPSATYNMPAAFRLTGSLNLSAFSESLNQIVRRHEALRTSFPTVDNVAVQHIALHHQISIPIVDLTKETEAEREAEVRRLLLSEQERPFDLANGPLWRVNLLRLGEKEHILLFTMHHIISDGWSIGVLVREFSSLYNAYSTGQPSPLPDLAIQYADFAHWQREWLTGEVLEQQLSYWKSQLADAPALLELPTDRPRPPVQSFRGGQYAFQLSKALSSDLLALSAQFETTLFMTLQAAFASLLYRYTGQEEILVGTPIANRNRAEIEPLIGFFVNTLVLRTDLSGHPTFGELLKQVRAVTLSAQEHQDLPFELLVEQLQPNRTLSHSPLFQIMFVLQNVPSEPLALEGLTLTPLEQENRTAKFDLTLSISEPALDAQQGLTGEWEYNRDLFDRATIQRMAGHFETLLRAIVANPLERIEHLPLLTKAQRHQIVVEWNQTQNDYPLDKSIHELFEEQAERTPDAVAIIMATPDDYGTQEAAQLTYRELNARANQLAHYLRTLGVGRESIVGICLERSPEIVVSMLAILKAGGAYLPLSASYPQERIQFMLADAQPRVVLTQAGLAAELAEAQAAPSGTQVLCLDREWHAIAGLSRANPKSGVTPDNLAYVIYTSGSTGQPKGVLVEHNGLCNSIVSDIRTYGIDATTRLLHVISFNFDAATSLLFMGICAGATIYLMGKDQTNLIHVLKKQAITHAIFTVSMWAALPETELPALKMVGTGAEVCPPDLVTRWGKGRRFFNIYGPTEATITSTYAECLPDGRKPTIGRPIANVQIYILDRHGNPTPIGVPGELYIGGVGVARGYLNRPELTEEKFIPNPFGPKGHPGKLYKTGDLARYLLSVEKELGNVEFLGRIDNQVKIRGLRIELGEIEAVLRQNKAVQEAVVTACPLGITREGKRGKQLVAYVVLRQEERKMPFANDQLRGFLKQKLPDYMVPHFFVQLDAMPLTPNGKIDRRALPIPEVQSKAVSLPPRNEVEQILATIWAELLGSQAVGIDDNFFELGGDSILSIQIVTRAKQAGLDLSTKQLFQHQTIAELAQVARPTKALPAEQGLVTGLVPLTPIQHWFFEQEPVEPHHYNQSLLLDVPSSLEPRHIELAVAELLKHHDALRLRFDHVEGWQARQLLPDSHVPFRVVDLSAEEEPTGRLEQMAAEVQASLNLSEGPLMQVVLFTLPTDLPSPPQPPSPSGRGGRRTENSPLSLRERGVGVRAGVRGAGGVRAGRLLIVIHHLAIDGVSWRILLSDLETAYQQLKNGERIQLPAKTTSFKAWANVLSQQGPQVVAESLPYWQAFAQLEVRPLPRDYPLGCNTVADTATISLSLDEEKTQALLKDVPSVYHTQINDLLLTALVQSFAEWTSQRSLLIDLEGHGREELFDNVDLSRTVGWFTSIFPVLLKLEQTEPGEALKSIKEQLRSIPNKGIGYGILRYLERAPALKAQAEVSFNYLGQFDQVQAGALLLGIAKEKSGPAHSLKTTRTHLLDLNAMVLGGQLHINCTYSQTIHQRATIERLAAGFIEALINLIAHCQEPSAGGYTPHDFPLAQLDQPTLDQLHLINVEDLYPLTPMQQDMLFHTLDAPNSGVYFNQLAVVLRGRLHLQAFKQAWQQLVDRHAVLRTEFYWEKLDQPLQVVKKRVELPWQLEDWQALSADEQKEQLQAFLQADRKQGFCLSQAPLMRCTLIKLSPSSYQFVYSHHHLLTDGWCFPIIIKEVFAFYQNGVRGDPLKLKRPRPYRDYIAWLQQQDQAQAETFWRQRLEGMSAPTPLVVDKLPSVDQKAAGVTELLFQLEIETTSALQTLARQHHLTLNTFFQGAWALLLSRLSGQEEVLFGATVSGRPPALRGVESMVGLFINTLPVRVDVPQDGKLLPWLQRLQQQQAEQQPYIYNTLTDIHGWSEIPPAVPLFESMIIFENYPAEEHDFGELQVESMQGYEQPHYPLTIFVIPDEPLSYTINYDSSRFAQATIQRMGEQLQTLLAGMVERPWQSLAQLPPLSQAQRHQLLMEWNDTQVDYPSELGIHDL